MPVLLPPVEAPIVRAFHYEGSPFAPGLHRGVDLAAAAGEPVLAPCAGHVAHAGATPADPAVTLVCGGRRVTLLGLRDIALAAGEAVPAGAVAGAAAAADGHTGLHLGVRRADDPLRYEDPEPLLGGGFPALGPAPPPGRRGRPPGRRPAAPARPPARPAPAPAPATTPAEPTARATLPWPAWLGAALVLAGATGGRARVRARRRARAGLAERPAGLA